MYLMPSGSVCLLHPCLYRSARLDSFDYREQKKLGSGRLRHAAPVCQNGAANFAPRGDRASEYSHSATTGKDVRGFLYSFGLRRPTVKQSCSLQDEDAADHVCHLA